MTHSGNSEFAAWRNFAPGLGESVEFHKEIPKNSVAADCRGRGAIEVSAWVEAPGVVVRDNGRRLEHCWDPGGIDHPAAAPHVSSRPAMFTVTSGHQTCKKEQSREREREREREKTYATAAMSQMTLL